MVFGAVEEVPTVITSCEYVISRASIAMTPDGVPEGVGSSFFQLFEEA